MDVFFVISINSLPVKLAVYNAEYLCMVINEHKQKILKLGERNDEYI